MSNKSSDNVKSAAEAATDPKALSQAAETAKEPANPDLNGDGKVTLTERVKALETLVDDLGKEINDLGKEIIELKSSAAKLAKIEDRLGSDKPGAKHVDVEQRLRSIETRLEQQFGAPPEPNN